ncbi:MAG: DciA family protein [Halorhodospira halophila]|uniref:DciA family protein n=1 Tax=Halorhodospira TaxID=85108 RepID=UPI0019138D79|nr:MULTISPECIES: DciA family protein [Halorhodospira]MBK5944339.1 hypothetical protein [Halorhodospira halophila]MCC3751399.1 DciA family protein [Halorhodospira halophila]MCG5527540.1 DciA family protein [Halorhodospira halophila]MCG5538435.1 DciA family protein [Halorhodospira sp. 9622]MCG5541716.1 DciA family protein [Halorhodospira sp. M39old]
MSDPKRFNPARPPRREGKLHRIAPRLAQRPGPLRAVIDHARGLERLGRRLQRNLPPETQGHWRLARLDEEEMVLIADGSGWGTRLRYLSRQLQDAAEAISGQRPRRVTVRVAPASSAPRKLQGPGPLSEQAANTLRRAAATSSDPALREALERLASRRRDED